MELLQPHIAIGYISVELGKMMRTLGIKQSVQLAPYTKRVLVFDQTQVTAGTIFSDVFQQTYFDLIGLATQHAVLFGAAIDKTSAGNTIASMVKTLETLTERLDERRQLRMYGAQQIMSQALQQLKGIMPQCVEWVAYAISCLYEE